MAYNDIEYLVRFFASSYGNSVNTIHTYEKVADYLQYDPIDEEGDEIEEASRSKSLMSFCTSLDYEVEHNSIMASASLASLVEIKQAIPEEEWFALQIKMPEVLKPLDEDIARYEALLAFHKAGLPMPDQDDPGVFVFGTEDPE